MSQCTQWPPPADAQLVRCWLVVNAAQRAQLFVRVWLLPANSGQAVRLQAAATECTGAARRYGGTVDVAFRAPRLLRTSILAVMWGLPRPQSCEVRVGWWSLALVRRACRRQCCCCWLWNQGTVLHLGRFRFHFIVYIQYYTF